MADIKEISMRNLYAILVIMTALLSAPLPGAETTKESPAPDLAGIAEKVEELYSKAEEAKAKEEALANGDAVADSLSKHVVRVKVWTKRDEGEWPSVGNARYDLINERPTLWGGYLWDEDSVLIEDEVLHDRFIRRIEVEAGGTTVEATMEARFRLSKAALLKLSEPLPGVTPLTFVDAPERKEIGTLRSVRYDHQRSGGWTLTVGGSVSSYSRTEDGLTFLAGGPSGLLVRPDGGVAGFTFDSRLGLAGPLHPWKGQELRNAELLTAEEKAAAFTTLEQRIRRLALGVKFEFRSQVEDDSNQHFSRWNRGGHGGNEQSEAFATGFAISPTQLLVPVALPREMIARLQTVSILVPGNDGAQTLREGTFAGALRNWQALLVDVKGDPLTDSLNLSGDAEFRPEEIFLKAHVDYSLRRRKERLSYDRFRGLFRTYDAERGVWTYTNEGDGSIAFTIDGKVLALAVAQRLRPTGEERHYGREENSIFRPVAALASALKAEDAIDPTYKPVEEVDEKKMIALGVEWQGFNVNIAKLLKATKETRGGEIGLLVQHVYEGTPAAKAGIQPKDILLRVKAPDRQEPIELRPGYQRHGMMFSDFMDMPEEARGMFMSQMPVPWPNRRNGLTELLTEIGEGHEVKVEYLRDGKIQSFTFMTAKSQPDFQAARKYKSKLLGLTVKELTHEVKRFYKREDDNAVVVSKVEMGGRASVAGVWPFQFITHVNGEPVESYNDFIDTVKALQEGQGSVEMTLEYMGKTRLVKMEL